MGCGASTASAPGGSSLTGFFEQQNPGPGCVKTVLFVRHANAAPRDAAAIAAEFGLPVDDLQQHANAWLASDLTRPLTEKVNEQAAAALASFMTSYSICLAVASEASRAIDTLKVVAGDFGADGTRSTLPQLHPSQSNAPDCEKMFDTLSYGPLRKFWDDTTTGVDGKVAYQKYAARRRCA